MLLQFSNIERMEEQKGDARIGPECFPSFVQATAFNKRAIMNDVTELTDPYGEADYEVALSYAFKTFEKVIAFIFI